MKDKQDNLEQITITVSQACQICNLSKTKLYKLLRSPECDFGIRVGPKKYLIRRQRLEEFLMNNDSI